MHIFFVERNATNLSATPNVAFSKSQTIALTLQSDPSCIARVTDLVDQLAKSLALSEATHGDLLLSLTEAVNNAIIHGNQLDVKKKVKLSLQVNNNKICVQVSDQGQGFDPRKLPDPTCSERICECGGRGVFLMTQLCEKMEFMNGGSTVKMQFAI